ncbi:unnamed protein product [Penicillium nalgiovense]|nr:unnamed protein product [Penicillium nalgiovense]
MRSGQDSVINSYIDDVAKESLIKADKPDLDLVPGLEDQKVATGVDQKPSSEDIDMPLAPKIDPTEPPTKVEKPDPGLAADLEDQKATIGVKEDPSCEDTEMPLAPTINPTEPLIKAEKPDPDLAAIPEDQKAATVVDQKPSCEDSDMPLAPTIDPAELSIKDEKPDPERNAPSTKQEPSYEDTEMPLAPKIDPNEPTASFDHSDSKCSLTPFGSQDLLKETRTLSSPESSDTKPQGQLCLVCFKQWGKQLESGERLVDCQIAHGSSPNCGQCLLKDSRCEIVSIL